RRIHSALQTAETEIGITNGTAKSRSFYKDAKSLLFFRICVTMNQYLYKGLFSKRIADRSISHEV
ncbi:MAG: hypothetical protein Q4F09_06660, partial [Erysipelotrichaceae bacterium]|nr:hypothetical protein [Erysipelotrichaceae bacterium]